MAIVIRYMYCLVFISRSSDLIQYGGIVTKANLVHDCTPTSYIVNAVCSGITVANRTLPVKRDGHNTPYTVYTGHWCSRKMSELDNSVCSG